MVIKRAGSVSGHRSGTRLGQHELDREIDLISSSRIINGGEMAFYPCGSGEEGTAWRKASLRPIGDKL